MIERVPFYSPELDRARVASADIEVKTVVAELLRDPRLAEEIEAGNVTLAMIRPQVGPDANIERLPDPQAADKIEGMIEGLGEMAKFSFKFTTGAATEFYQGGPEASMRKEPAIDPDRYESRWPEFVDFMTSGPTTAIILYSPDGDAIERWRAHLGHWNIDQIRDPATIRGSFGVNKYNNLVHGSDAPTSVLREIGIIADCLMSEQ